MLRTKSSAEFVLSTKVGRWLRPEKPKRIERGWFKGGLNFEAVYYVLSNDYNRYMDIHQAIHLAIFDAFASRGIDFAFPTQTIHLHNEKAPA